MDTRHYARVLGRRGGRARARKLSPEQRKKIASMGGKSRALSRHAARRIEENFKYLEAIEALRKAAVIHGTYTSVSSKYQVALPKEVQERLAMKPGQKLIVYERGGIIHLIPKVPVKNLKGC